MSITEKDEENIKEIEELYLFDAILFENTVLIKDDTEYSICHVPKENIYDICIQDIHHTKIIKYEQVKKLTPKQEKYFNLLQGESITDDDSKTIKCVSHNVEYVF